MMDSSRKAAMAVGTLYIVGTVAGVASMLCTAPISGDADFFAKAASSETMIRIGAIFILVRGFSLAFIPAVIIPVPKKWSESLAAVRAGTSHSRLPCLSRNEWPSLEDRIQLDRIARSKNYCFSAISQCDYRAKTAAMQIPGLEASHAK